MPLLHGSINIFFNKLASTRPWDLYVNRYKKYLNIIYKHYRKSKKKRAQGYILLKESETDECSQSRTSISWHSNRHPSRVVVDCTTISYDENNQSKHCIISPGPDLRY